MKKPTTADYIFWAVIAIMVLLMIALFVAICEDIKGGQMKDSKGNEFGVGDEFRSSKEGECSLSLIKCIGIGRNVGGGEKRVARMEWINTGGKFDLDQKNLLTSHWVKFEHSHIPARRGKGD